jgi:hypothetical protein
MKLEPQPGFQTAALSTSADIAIIGGSAGSGKTFILELEPCRHVNNPNFGATIFRRTTTQIKSQGGLWDTSQKIYPITGAYPRHAVLEWVFPSGAKVKFSHLEHEKNILDWQGSQIPLIIFDELTQFTEYMFWYLVGRNRTDCGVRPYVRASCNPDPNSWVAKLIEWWIDQETGFPIAERSGVVRYLTRDGDRLVWGRTKAEVIEQCPHIFGTLQLVESGVDVEQMVKSFTFIPGTIYENKLFIAKDPSYLGTLLSLPEEEKRRLLKGNWKISLDGLMLCQWEKIERIFDNYPEADERPLRCITVDAARFGRDFAVIYVWKGWEVIFTVVYKISDAHDLNDRIERLRARYNVMKDDVLIDADGVGDGTVKLGSYEAFHGGSAPLPEPGIFQILKYKNLKTQCHYKMAQKVNEGAVRVSFNNETVEIHDATYPNGVLSMRIKIGSEVKDVRDLLKEDLRTWKRKETADEGVDTKQMITKEEQKNTLKRSPDWGDCFASRFFFELRPKRKTMTRTN